MVSKKRLPPIYYVGGIFMLDIQKEKQLIYDLLRKLIDERRELNKQYEELKQRLDNLNSMEQLSAEILSGNKKTFQY